MDSVQKNLETEEDKVMQFLGVDCSTDIKIFRHWFTVVTLGDDENKYLDILIFDIRQKLRIITRVWHGTPVFDIDWFHPRLLCLTIGLPYRWCQYDHCRQYDPNRECSGSSLLHSDQGLTFHGNTCTPSVYITHRRSTVTNKDTVVNYNTCHRSNYDCS